MRTGSGRMAVVAALAIGAALPAIPHLAGGTDGGFAAGLAHPIGGLDHLLAMGAVGLWAAQTGGRALWAMPAAFILAMVAGGAWGLAGIALPGIELGILASLLALGGAVAASMRPPVAVSLAVVAAFALFHGHAHGAEMPDSASPAVYAAGFVLATAILHVAGIAAAQVVAQACRSHGDRVVRTMGAAIAAFGAFLLAQ